MRERWGWWIPFWFSIFSSMHISDYSRFTIDLCTILGLWFKTQVTTDPQLSSFSWECLPADQLGGRRLCLHRHLCRSHTQHPRMNYVSSVSPILSPIWALNSSILLLYNFCPLCLSMPNAFWEIRIFQLICFSFWRPEDAARKLQGQPRHPWVSMVAVCWPRVAGKMLEDG